MLDPCAAEESLGASVSLCLVEGRWLVFHQARRSQKMFGCTGKETFHGEPGRRGGREAKYGLKGLVSQA